MGCGPKPSSNDVKLKKIKGLVLLLLQSLVLKSKGKKKTKQKIKEGVEEKKIFVEKFKSKTTPIRNQCDFSRSFLMSIILRGFFQNKAKTNETPINQNPRTQKSQSRKFQGQVCHV